MQYTKEQKREKYNKLPQEMRDALLSMETAEAIFETTKKYGLGVKESGIVADETGNVMLGLTRSDEYIKQLSEHLEIEDDVVAKIATEINQSVFSKVRVEFREATGGNTKEIKREQKSVPIPNNLPGIPKEEGQLQGENILEFREDGTINDGENKKPLVVPAPPSTKGPGEAKLDNVNSEIEKELGIDGDTAKSRIDKVVKKIESIQQNDIPVAVTNTRIQTDNSDTVDPYREKIGGPEV
ncbi:hypothetical protein COB55_00620 [Candidatus Wolfebacteria bacterium]|nr:MAG: hypothetical protein COB55_00620 [Candidatus Wolfebacteria bacterium]